MRCAWAAHTLQHLAVSLGSHKLPASAQPAVLPLHSALAAWLADQAPHCTQQVRLKLNDPKTCLFNAAVEVRRCLL